MTNFSVRCTPAVVAVLVLTLCAAAAPASAQSPTVTDGGVDADFPDRLVFRASAESSAEIEKVRLRYEILPDGTRATGEAEFQPGQSVSASFALQAPDKPSLYLPPGTTINYHWEITDAAGNEAETPEGTFVYTDQRFEWASLSESGVTVYYYAGSEEDARDLLAVAAATFEEMSALLQAEIDFPVKVWIYDSVEDMRPALPERSETYESRVITAGIRVATDTVLVLGNASYDTLRHELTHVITAAAGEGPLGTIPAWLDEGTAVYAQRDPGGFSEAIEQAIRRGNVFSVRSITSSPGDPNKVGLFYGQSWSLVKYLIDTYGEEKFARLFAEIQTGKRIDSALEAVYGFNQDGLEDEWRAANDLPPQHRAEPTEPDRAEETEPAGGGGEPRPLGSDDGGSSGTTAVVAIVAALVLAGLIGVAGWALARRYG